MSTDADRDPGTVLLTQAATPTEARLIRDRIAAAGGTEPCQPELCVVVIGQRLEGVEL